jgi:hypothetical protein
MEIVSYTPSNSETFTMGFCTLYFGDTINISTSHDQYFNVSVTPRTQNLVTFDTVLITPNTEKNTKYRF